MKAYAFSQHGSVDDLELVELATPCAGRGELLVRLRAASLNPADLKIMRGDLAARFIHALKPPLRFGYDFSGDIEAYGEGVAGFRVGDEVFGFLPYARTTSQGSLADYVVADAGATAIKPSSIPHVEAACAATTASTAWQSMINLGGLKSGQRVLVNGASGGVGSFAVQIAKHVGAEVWGRCSAANLDYVRSLGASQAVDYRESAIGSLNQSFDLVFDVVSNASYRECRSVLAPQGALVTLLPSFGLLTGKLWSLFSNRSCKLCMVKPRRETLDAIGHLMECGTIVCPVERVFPFDGVPDALSALADGGIKGKLGIER